MTPAKILPPFTKVCFIKTDLDTLGAAFLMLGASGQLCDLPKLEELTFEADESLLKDSAVLCLECGGSGRTAQQNYDHHSNGVAECAMQQAWRVLGMPECYRSLVEYTAGIDLGLNFKAGSCSEQNRVRRPTLSALMSGVLSSADSASEAFRAGLALLEHAQSAVELGLCEFEDLTNLFDIYDISRNYWQIKCRNTRELLGSVKEIKVLMSVPVKVLMLISSHYGVHGLLRRSGADVSVAGDGAGRFSISVKPGLEHGLRSLRCALNIAEPGWGGPVGDRILSSPHGGSRMTQGAVAEAVCRAFTGSVGSV